MPGSVPPVADERDGLLAFLAQQRYVLRLTAYGLTDEQLRATPCGSQLSVGGLIKHVAKCERGWIDTVVQRDRGLSMEEAQAEYENDFRLVPGETIDDVFALYDDVAAETERVIASMPDLDRPVPVPPAPWYPDDLDAWSVRWVLLHLIEETARHAGHADIVREAVDGATAFPLMAAAEGWPESPWMQPWRPASTDDGNSVGVSRR